MYNINLFALKLIGACVLIDKPRDPVISMPDAYPEEGKPLFIECSFDAHPPATVFYTKEDPVTKQWERIGTGQVCDTVSTYVRCLIFS